MCLYHVSEEPNIQVFKPRLPERKDLDQNIGLVWALDEARLPNFFTPRDCPRVAYHVNSQTTDVDKQRFFTSHLTSYAIVIESKLFRIMNNTTLYLYEFDPQDFVLQVLFSIFPGNTLSLPVPCHTLCFLFPVQTR